MPEPAVETNLISRTPLRRRYRLSTSAIRLLGDCDEVRPNPHSPNAPPAFFYDRRRVEEFVIQQRLVKQKGIQRRALELIPQFEIEPLPPADQLVEFARAFLLERYGNCPSFITDNALCAFILHRRSNGVTILEEISALVGKCEPYQRVKLILCCEIMLACDLSGDPRAMVGGDGHGQTVLAPRQIVVVRDDAIRELRSDGRGN